ncbi:MAG TPA: hypothetical protein VJ885_00365 [Thermoanaerobaculia bacterium]|jgi:hypothetical protein|nr:hypothetical protein [Thermoanaerobaculia bacterium]
MEELSVRELQAYGAACLARYCAEKGIHSKHVEWLVDHLLLVLVSTRLPVWETAGTMFELTGRGEPLPPDLVELIPEGELSRFERLVSCVVKIGMVDMYGGDTSQSLRSARESREVLESADVKPPSVEDLFPSRQQGAERGWGEPVPGEQYRHARTWCLRMMKPRPTSV